MSSVGRASGLKGGLVPWVFGLDARSLALYRVCISVVMLGDLVDRALYDLQAHYTDEGIVPRSLVLSHFWNRYFIVPHIMNGTLWFAAAMFLLHAMIVLSLLVGYKTKLMAVLTWFMACSLQERTEIIGHGGDMLLRVMLFWTMFVPIEKCYTVDCLLTSADLSTAKNKKRQPSHKILTVGGMAFISQLMIMYIASVFYKSGETWRVEGSATYYSLRIDYFRTVFGEMMLALPYELLQGITFAVLFWELAGPFTFISPIRHDLFRTLGAFGFISMHGGIGLSMRLGTFTWVTSVCMLAILPAPFWDNLLIPLLGKLCKPRIIIYCNTDYEYLTAWMRAMKKFFLLPSITQVRLVHDQEFFLKVKELDGQNRTYFEEDTIAPIFAASPLLRPLSVFLVSRITRFICYQLVDERISSSKQPRHRLGLDSTDNGMSVNSSSSYGEIQPTSVYDDDELSKVPPSKSKIFYAQKPRLNLGKKIRKCRKVLVAAFVFLMLCYVVVWNLHELNVVEMSDNWIQIGWATHMDQKWSMFSANPPVDNWWHTIEAFLENGSVIDIFGNEGLWKWEGKEFDPNKPADSWKNYYNHRWFKMWEAVNQDSRFEIIRIHFAQYICREWNRRHSGDAKLKALKIWYYFERNWPNGTAEYKGDQMLWKQDC